MIKSGRTPGHGLVLLAALVAPAVVAGAFASESQIPKGAHVLLRMENTVSSRTARVGDYVYLRTASPIAGRDGIIVPVGSYVQGAVAAVKRSGRVKGRAELAIRLESLTTPQGRVFSVAPRVTSVDDEGTGQKVDAETDAIRQGSSVGKDVGQVAILAGSGASIGAIADRRWRGVGIGAGAGTAVGLATAMLTRGREVEIRRGSTLDVVFDRPVTLE
jgi:hypothetical protein